jgi:DsbC/DsbD-like thiol-disulfide interchange protein
LDVDHYLPRRPDRGRITPTPTLAQFEGRSVDEVVQVSLIEGWRMENGRHMAGISIALAPGWKTYWRAPGEGGVPTVLRLRSAEGIEGMAIHWPRPEVFFTNGMRSIGYRDDVVLPVEFAVPSDGAVDLHGRLELGVCLDICMPVTLDLNGELLPGGERDRDIGLALSDRPLTAAEAGAGTVRCDVEPISDGLRVTVTADVPATGNDETLVLEHRDPQIWVSEADDAAGGRDRDGRRGPRAVRSRAVRPEPERPARHGDRNADGGRTGRLPRLSGSGVRRSGEGPRA